MSALFERVEHGITRRKLLGGAGALTVAFSLTPANSARRCSPRPRRPARSWCPA